MEQMLTHHMIDDLAAQDEAMQAFLLHFPFLPGQVTVSEDGRLMVCRLRGTRITETYLLMARTVIACWRLPLKVEQDVFRIGAVIIENNMLIHYTGK